MKDRFTNIIKRKYGTKNSPVTEGSFTERAQAKVREILATHKPPLIKEAVEDEIGMIIQAAEKDIMDK